MVNWNLAKRLLKDPRAFPEFCEKHLVIQPEEGGALVPYKLNLIQVWFHFTIVVPLYEAGVPIRVIILKARQMGFSTYIEAFTFWSTIGHAAWSSLVIGEDEKQATTLFRMMRRFDEHLDDGEGINVFPEFPKRKDREEALEYNVPAKTHRGKMYVPNENGRDFTNTQTDRYAVALDSRIEVRSAEKKGSLGRAGTYQTIHASEVAYWPRLLPSLGALLGAVHDRPETAVFLETTANGMNAFYSFWQNLQVGQMEVPSIWKRVFIPWYCDNSYEFAESGLRHEFINEYEEGLFKRIVEDRRLHDEIESGINEERIWDKIFWYRKAILDKFFGDPEMMKQEFPSSDAEAFLFSGISAYTAASLAKIESTIREPIWQGNIELKATKEEVKKEKAVEDGDEDEDSTPPRTKVVLEQHERGKLKIWRNPDKGHMYVLFADVAEGMAIEGVSETKSKWDFSAVQLFQVTSWPPTMKQAAVWHGNCNPDVFGDILVALGRHYNMAFAGWEINGPGRSVGLQVIQKNKYKNVYMRPDFDSITKRPTRKPGWRTTSRSKPDMVACSQMFVRQGELEIYDAGTYTEMKAFSRMGQKWGAATGHDDRVIGVCGVCIIIEERLIAMKRKYDLLLEEDKEKPVRDPRQDFGDEDEHFNPTLGEEW